MPTAENEEMNGEEDAKDERKMSPPKIKRNNSTLIVTIFVITVVILATILNVFYINSTKSESVSGKIRVIDSAGNVVILKKAPARIVAISGIEEIIILGAFDKVVGMYTNWETYRHDMWDKYMNESGYDLSKIPFVADKSLTTVDVEKIVSLKPDLVVYRNLNFYTAERGQLAKFGIASVYVDFYTQGNTVASIMILGEALGVSERAKEVADFYQTQVNKVYGVLANITKTRPKVYFENGGVDYGSYGPTYMWGGLVESAGGKDIAAGAGLVNYGIISGEYVLSQNPDIIIMTGYDPVAQKSIPELGYYTTLEEAKDGVLKRTVRTGWANLTAMKTGRVYAISHELSRTIPDFVSLQYFAKWFYPEEFTGLDPEANWKEFHTRFLPVSYSGTWTVGINQ